MPNTKMHERVIKTLVDEYGFRASANGGELLQNANKTNRKISDKELSSVYFYERNPSTGLFDIPVGWLLVVPRPDPIETVGDCSPTGVVNEVVTHHFINWSN